MTLQEPKVVKIGSLKNWILLVKFTAEVTPNLYSFVDAICVFEFSNLPLILILNPTNFNFIGPVIKNVTLDELNCLLKCKINIVKILSIEFLNFKPKKTKYE